MPHKPTLCTGRKVMGVNMSSAEEPHILGGWAEKIYIDAEKFWVYKVSDEVAPEVAVLSEPMAVSARAVDRLPLDEIVTHKYNVKDAQESIDTLKARKGIKHALTG